MNRKIDFVVTWVDSSDKKWLAKKNKSLQAIGKPMEDAAGDERYRDYGTLKYLLRSIEKYAEWVNKIYLITDEQKPTWMKENLSDTKLCVIDHKDIIPKDALPTFNSNAIELCIDNISELSESFVVFNDDWLINKKVSPLDFFDKNGVPKDFRLYKALIANSPYDQLQFNDIFAINSMIRENGKWPFNNKGMFSFKYPLRSNLRNLYFKIDGHSRISNYVIPHNALSFTKETFSKAKLRWKKEVDNTIRQNFRSVQDVTMLLFRDYQLETGNFSIRSPKFSKYFVLNQAKEVKEELVRQKHSLLCINDAGTTNYEDNAKILQKALEEKFNGKSNFEK